MGTPAPDRSTCEIRNWRVFGPGWHKQKYLYTPAMVARIPHTFARLSSGPRPVVDPSGKLGHDHSRRFAESLGLGAIGTIRAVRTEPDGTLVIEHMTDVPPIVGRAIKSRMIKSGSVELDDDHPDPADPAKTIDGPILTGVSFLGEEPPAVKGLGPIPDPTYPDGAPVEPLGDAEQTQVMRAMLEARDAEPREFSAKRRRFAASELFTDPPERAVDAASIIAALQADPALMEQVMAACGGGKMAEVPPTPAPAPDQMMSAFEGLKKEMSERVGALEASRTKEMADAAQTAEQKCMSRVFADCEDAVIRGNILRRDLELHRDAGVALLTGKKKKFGDKEFADGEAAYAAFKADLGGRRALGPDTGPGAAPKPAATGPAVGEVGREIARPGGFLDRQGIAAGLRTRAGIAG